MSVVLAPTRPFDMQPPDAKETAAEALCRDKTFNFFVIEPRAISANALEDAEILATAYCKETGGLVILHRNNPKQTPVQEHVTDILRLRRILQKLAVKEKVHGLLAIDQQVSNTPETLVAAIIPATQEFLNQFKGSSPKGKQTLDAWRALNAQEEIAKLREKHPESMANICRLSAYKFPLPFLPTWLYENCQLLIHSVRILKSTRGDAAPTKAAAYG